MIEVLALVLSVISILLFAAAAYQFRGMRWEERWFPIDTDGDEWVPRTEAECDDLIADYARPDHFIHEPNNSDMSYAIAKRGERRLASPWRPAPERRNAGGSDE